MHLTVLLPFQIFASESAVARIVVETRQGSFGLLPRRLDCVAALTPGILIFATAAAGDVYLAVDEGVLVKSGRNVLVSVRRAIGGADLDQLRSAVEEEFLALDDLAQNVRAVMAKLETGFLRRLVAYQHE
jgi:F-type H+-transporting ATPase subunit epsilon